MKGQLNAFDALWQAVGAICDLFEPHECWNYLRAAGYASVYSSDALALPLSNRQEILFVAALRERASKAHETLAADPAEIKGDLLRADHMKTLALFQRGRNLRSRARRPVCRYRAR